MRWLLERHRWALHFALAGKNQDTLIFVMCFLAIIPLVRRGGACLQENARRLTTIDIAGGALGLHDGERDHVDIANHRRTRQCHVGEHGRADR